MNISKLIVGSFLIASIYSSTVSAALVVCEPDDFAAGTNLANACSGVSLSVVTRSDDVLAQVPFVVSATSTGSQVFGHGTDSFGWGIGDADPEGLRGDFDTLTNYVSIDIIGNDPSDGGFLSVYDSSGILLDQILTGLIGTGAVFSAIITSASNNIAYFIASGFGGDNVNLDNLRFDVATSVPAPTPLMLLGLGLAGLFMARKRYQNDIR